MSAPNLEPDRTDPNPTPHGSTLDSTTSEGPDTDWIVELDLRIEALRERIQAGRDERALAVAAAPPDTSVAGGAASDHAVVRTPHPPIPDGPSPDVPPVAGPASDRPAADPTPGTGRRVGHPGASDPHGLSRELAIGAVSVAVVVALGIGAFFGVQQLDVGTTVASPPSNPAAAPDLDHGDEPLDPTPVRADSPAPAPYSGTASEVDDRTVAPSPPPTPVRPGEILATAADLLTAGGHPGLSLRFDNGTLEIAGVLPTDELADGYFAATAAIEELVADIDGVDRVRSRLYLRGDEAELRRRLTAIADGGRLEFSTGSAELSSAARGALTDAAAVIMDHPGLRIVVAGHADPRGSAEANAALAAQRAEAVVVELFRLGVPVTRLQAVTYGELFADGAGTDAASRRVEFEVAA